MGSPEFAVDSTLQHLLVKDVMSEPVAVSANATLEQVARVMLEHDADVVAVIDEHGRLCGAIGAAALTLGRAYLGLAGVVKPELRGLWFAPPNIVEVAAENAKGVTARSFMRRPSRLPMRLRA